MLGLSSFETRALTLQEATQLAVDTHPSVLAFKALKRSREEAINEARAPFFPEVNARSAGGYEYSNTPGTRGRVERTQNFAGRNAHVDLLHVDSEVLMRQMIFDGFETWNRKEAAKIRSEATDFQIRGAQELIALRAVEAYLSVLRLREIVTLAAENVENHVEVLDDVRVRAREGGGSIADVRQAEARLALSRTRLTVQRGDLRDAETDFVEAVGTAPDELSLSDPPEQFVPESMEAAVEEALARNPAITAATLTVDARRTDIEVAKGGTQGFWPRIDLELSAQRNRHIQGSEGGENFYRAFAVVRWNLFRGGATLARTRRLTELASEAVQLEAERRRLVVEQMRVDYNKRQTALDRLPTLEDRVLAADQVVSAYQQQFQLGQRTLLDVLDVENELFQARVSLVEGEFDLRVSNYQILASIGTLAPSLGVIPAESETATE